MKRNQYSKGTVIVTAVIVFLSIYAVITLLWIGAAPTPTTHNRATGQKGTNR